uniref:GrpE like 2, mitochondrial n=1 Tax=Leptobrachium leishanense TaxID=445787 RepID=A0A8C5MRC2_9ANUR
MYLARCSSRVAVDQLGALLSRNSRNVLSAFCAASPHRHVGDYTRNDDPTGDDGKSFTVTSLERKAQKLEQQVEELKEKQRVAMADSENVRRGIQKYVMDAKLFGIQSLCRDLVEVADLVEDASAQAATDGKVDVIEILSQLDTKLQRIFSKHGLQKMTPIGSVFDPYDHTVVCHVPAEGRELGTVAVVRQEGYKLHGRTIRHAHVGLAVASPERAKH